MIKVNIIGMLLLGITAVSTADTGKLKARDKITSITTQDLVKVGDTVDVNTVYAPVTQCTAATAKESNQVIKDCANRRPGWLKL
jgi:hypothetical protein